VHSTCSIREEANGREGGLDRQRKRHPPAGCRVGGSVHLGIRVKFFSGTSRVPTSRHRAPIRAVVQRWLGELRLCLVVPVPLHSGKTALGPVADNGGGIKLSLSSSNDQRVYIYAEDRAGVEIAGALAFPSRKRPPDVRARDSTPATHHASYVCARGINVGPKQMTEPHPTIGVTSGGRTRRARTRRLSSARARASRAGSPRAPPLAPGRSRPPAPRTTPTARVARRAGRLGVNHRTFRVAEKRR